MGDIETLQELWAEHGDIAFPKACHDSPAGVELVLVDADIAGCVSSMCNRNGKLKAYQISALLGALSQLERVIPVVKDSDAWTYCVRLRDLGQLALDEHNRRNACT